MNSSESDESSPTGLAELTRASLIMRFTAIGVVIAGIAGLFAYMGGWLTPHALTPASMINRFEHLNGLHPGFRRNHAKGVCVSGHFESSGRGAALSKASVFLAGRIPIIGRFHYREASRMSLIHRTRCAAWAFCSNCRTAKNGAPP